jgi:hypothetical protein
MPVRTLIRPVRPFIALVAAVTVFACRADNALRSHRPSAYAIPLLPDSQPVRWHGAIVGVVLDSATRRPLPGWSATLYWNDDPTPPLAPKLTWIQDDTSGGFGVYHLIPNTKGYEIRCRAPNSRTIWKRGLRIASGAVDTIVCLMQPGDSHTLDSREEMGPR